MSLNAGPTVNFPSVKVDEFESENVQKENIAPSRNSQSVTDENYPKMALNKIEAGSKVKLSELISPPYTPVLPSHGVWNLAPAIDHHTNQQIPNHTMPMSNYILNNPSNNYIMPYPNSAVKKVPLGTSNAINATTLIAPTHLAPSSSSSIQIPKLIIETAAKRNRKMKLPQRAISPPRDQVDRSFQRIVNLDVYAAFKSNPAKLLGRGNYINNDSDSESYGKSSPPIPVVSLPAKKQAVSAQSACKILPTFITEKEPQNMDLSCFKNTKGAPLVSWKGAQPLMINPNMPEFDDLTPEEVKTCATLRILPSQYLEIKRTLLTAVNVYGPFKKREAQTWFRIDVNKICIIYDWFKTLQWIPNNDEWSATVDPLRRASNADQYRPTSKKVRRR